MTSRTLREAPEPRPLRQNDRWATDAPHMSTRRATTPVMCPLTVRGTAQMVRAMKWEVLLDCPGGPTVIARVLENMRRRQESEGHGERKTRGCWPEDEGPSAGTQQPPGAGEGGSGSSQSRGGPGPASHLILAPQAPTQTSDLQNRKMATVWFKDTKVAVTVTAPWEGNAAAQAWREAPSSPLHQPQPTPPSPASPARGRADAGRQQTASSRSLGSADSTQGGRSGGTVGGHSGWTVGQQLSP